jgi:PAS domain S-box-containing protein
MPSPPAGTASPVIPSGLRLAAGPLLTLLFAVVSEWLRPTPFHIPGQGVVFTLFVVWSSFVGGRAPGLVSAVLAASYLAWLNANSTSPLRWSGDNLARVRILCLTLPLLAWMTGELRDRAVRAAARGRTDRELRDLLEQSPSCVFLADATGHYLYANPRALELTGYALDELRGMSFADLASPESLAERPLQLDVLRVDRPHRSHRWLRRRDGSRFLADIAGRRLPDGRLLGDVRDVTAEHEATVGLERTLATLNATLESTVEGILVIDETGRWLVRNQRFNAILRVPEELLASGDVGRVREYLAAQAVDPELFLGRVHGILADAEAESFDEIVFRDGRVVERSSIPLRVGGRCAGRVWSLHDVTESRQQAAALRESERRVMQSQKIEAIGRLAGGVAHDFNNMLTAILGESEMLLADLPAGGDARAAVGRIRDVAERSARLTRQLLTFSRRRQQPALDLDLRQMLLEIEPIMWRLARPGHELRIGPPEPGEPLRVRAEAPMLEQAVINLVVNAYDAMPEGGAVDVRLYRETLTAEEAVRRAAPHPGEYACIEVADTGNGIAEDVRPHLFEPFFTTKSPGKGTGLGLASVHGAVHEVGGFVEVESAPDRGALFRLLLPALDGAGTVAAPAPSPRASRAVPPAGAGGEAALVLLAEDEDAVRLFVATVLRREGFRVVEAANGAEALAAFAAMPEPPALLLSDVRMPGLSGIDLARRLRARRPELRVVLMSGWAGEALEELESDRDGLPLLAKPFGGDAMLAIVRATLAGETARSG